jgi:hypothetical protein
MTEHERRAHFVAQSVRVQAMSIAKLMPSTAEAMLTAADELGEAWADEADRNPAVARYLDAEL